MAEAGAALEEAIDMDTGPDPGTEPPTGLDRDERAHALDVAAALFARNGPGPMTMKWVALDAGMPVERLSAEWPTVEILLGQTLDRVADQFRALQEQDLDRDEVARRDELIDTFQRIIARSLLDGVNPGNLLSSFALVEKLAADLQERFGLDDRTTRVRLAQGYALEWGWHLFGPYLKLACGLSDVPDVELLADLRRAEMGITRAPGASEPGR
jgi:hypothetical protein